MQFGVPLKSLTVSQLQWKDLWKEKLDNKCGGQLVVNKERDEVDNNQRMEHAWEESVLQKTKDFLTGMPLL